MNSFKKLMLVIVVLLSAQSFAQVKNTITETVKVSGNCGMCKSNIEKAGNKEDGAKVLWDAKSQRATLTYNASKTSKDKILKRIAQAGYDNEMYAAPDNVYEELHGCCQYDRTLKDDAKQNSSNNSSPE